MVNLKADATHIRLYRDEQGRWVTRLGALKAVASSAGIAAWVVWKQYAFMWGAIIAASQLADALKDVFPFAKKHKAASALSTTLDHLFNDVQLEWENIFAGRYSDVEIMNRLHGLRKFQIDALQHSIPDGLVERRRLLIEAKRITEVYFANTYGVNSMPGGEHG